jgi:hypothetical protein
LKRANVLEERYMKRLLVAMLLLFPLTAMADTYEWTDEGGTLHFAEDLGKVPKKFRKKAKVIAEETGIPQTSILGETPAAEKPKGAEEPQKKKVYGGKDESAWRRDFGSARRELQNGESNLSELQTRLNDTSNMSRSEYLSIQNSIKQQEIHVQGLRRKVDQLQESADRAGVPRDVTQ